MSFLNILQILLTERKDIEFGNKIHIMTKKIVNFIKNHKKLLLQNADKLYKEGEGYYFHFKIFDANTKYTDLFIAFLFKDMSNYKNVTKLDVGNPAAIRKLVNADKTITQYIVECYVLDREKDEPFDDIFTIIQSPSWNSSLAHELTHYLDQKKQSEGYSDNEIRKNLKLDDADINTIADSLKQYYNLTDEINAHFHQTAVAFLKTSKERKKNTVDFLTMPFENFKEAFIYFYSKKAFENLNPQNRKKILTRIYTFYDELQDYLKKKKK